MEAYNSCSNGLQQSITLVCRSKTTKFWTAFVLNSLNLAVCNNVEKHTRIVGVVFGQNLGTCYGALPYHTSDSLFGKPRCPSSCLRLVGSDWSCLRSFPGLSIAALKNLLHHKLMLKDYERYRKAWKYPFTSVSLPKTRYLLSSSGMVQGHSKIFCRRWA